MGYIQQKYAHDLYDRLVRRFAFVSAQTEITVSGGGVNWECLARRGQKSCLVHCFDNQGPEFLTFFKQDEKEIASARTASQAETVEALWYWLDDSPLDALYGRFKFVDWQKRELAGIQDIISRDFPDLAVAVQSELAYWGSALYHLWLRSETRSVQIYFYGKNEHPEAVFHWDQCELFRFNADDYSALGTVLKRWLSDNAAPSAMRKEFPWLKIGELADYYENGNPIEGEFLKSWAEIEQFYDNDNFSLKTPVLQFLAELRQAGYNQTLRAGQSMWTFILSRSRRHRLRPQQPYIRFEFHDGRMDVSAEYLESENISGTSITLSSQVEKVGACLTEQPIT